LITIFCDSSSISSGESSYKLLTGALKTIMSSVT